MIKLPDFSLPEAWPYGLRLFMYASAVLWIAAYGYLKAFPPKVTTPAVSLDFTEFREVGSGSGNTGIGFVLTVINNTDKTEQITNLELAWYEDKEPEGGFLSNKGIDATYRISATEDGMVATSGDGAPLPVELTINKPYANSSFLKVDIPTAERLKDTESTRFFVIFEDRSFLSEDLKKTRARLTFSNGAVAERELVLR